MAGLQNLLGFLFGSSDGRNEADDKLLATVVDEIVDVVDPRLRMHGSYQKRLTPAARVTLAHLRALRDRLPPQTLTLESANWAHDPRLNAFFATAGEVPAFLGRSRPLRALFKGEGAAATEAFGLLAMRYEERRVLANKLVGDQLQHDVAQTTVSFSKHRLFAPALSLPAARMEVGRQLFLRLGQLALKRIVEADERAADLTQHKGYLGTRLRLLNMAKDGLGGIVDDPATIDQQIRDVEREMKETVDQFIEVKSGIATLDDYLERVREILENPAQHLELRRTPVRVNRLGIKLEPGEQDATANDLVLDELDLGDTRVVIAMVRCPRSEIPPEQDLIAEAERWL
jgi:hypothetical protein